MGTKQTAMQELMEWMIEESQVIPVDPGYVYDKAKELLVKEKEQMLNFADDWRNECLTGGYSGDVVELKSVEQYYNETYGK